MNTEARIESRNRHRCIACNSERLISQWSVISSFFAERALLTKPGTVPIFNCLACGTQYFDLLVTDEQLARLYDAYRGEEYFKQRNYFEPWYTRAINDGMGSEVEMKKRRGALKLALEEAGINVAFGSALDHGGDRGQMLLEINAARKAVFDVSGVATEPEIDAIGEQEMRACKWDLILSCHVLEHLTSPATYVTNLMALGSVNAIYFFEVPNESVEFSRFNATNFQRRWLAWLAKRTRTFQFFDFLSTAIRARLRVVPPLMFFPLREHLTFFTAAGLESLLTRSGLSVLKVKVLETGHIGVVAVLRK